MRKTEGMHEYKAGQRVHLDSVYEIQGLIPDTTSHNCDEHGTPDEGGDWVEFTKDVKIKYTRWIK